jgi:hypothetical protein
MWQIGLNQFENEFELSTETVEYYCTIGFYLFLAFQRHKICKIWIHGLKDMNLQRFRHLNSNLNLIEPSRATCRVLVGWYRFGKIVVLVR